MITNKKNEFFISVVFVFSSFFIAGWLGIIFEILISLIIIKIVDGINEYKVLKTSLKNILLFAGLLIGLGVQLVGVIIVAEAVQNSIMGR